MPFEDDEYDTFGGDDAFKGRKWFQDTEDIPHRAQTQPSAPQTVGTQYAPLPDVIERNNAFIYALESAPNVVYERFKQFGQLGVLGWCSEFSDLIDDLKGLGLHGNMFVNTRAQALQTCQELLRLKLDIGMQIIIIHFSSQIRRLRRFLDGETDYDDYPETQFPIDPADLG